MKRILFILFCLPLFVSAQNGKDKYGKYVFNDSVYFKVVPYSASAGVVHLAIDTVAGSPTYGKLVRKTASGGAGLVDGNYGDVTVGGTGTTMTINNGAVSNVKLANSTISGVALGSNLANLTATNSTLTFSGTYNGSTARDIGINLSNANTWAADQSVPDEAFDPTNWNGSVEVPTKNAIRDQVILYQTLSNLNTNTSLGSSNTEYPSQLAVKTYVDNTAAAQTPKAAVDYATTAALAANTYANGTAGVGATITMNANGTVTIDGHVTALGENILIKDESSQLKNGIYTVTTAGAGGAAGVFTRRTDFDVAAEVVVGAETFVINGSANAGKKFTQNSSVTTMGTDAITFVQTGGASGVTWGAVTGTLSSQTDLQSELDLKANLASPTFTGTVTLPNSTVTNAMLAGSIDLTTKVTGVLPAANGGTGVNNSTRTLTVSTNSGTIAFSSASKTLTVDESITINGTDGTVMTFPSTSATIARTDAANTFTGVQTLSSAPVLSTGTVTIGGNTVTFPSATGTVVYGDNTTTLTNKRVTPRTGTVASSGTPTINTDNVDYYSITALAANITSFTTNLSGTPTDAQQLWISITDNGTARSIAWGNSFEAGAVALPTTTVISTRLDVMFIWNAATSKWRCMAAG